MINFTPDQKLMALSWKQPYAGLMLHGKQETRTWDTRYRGWVLICSSQRPYQMWEVLQISGSHKEHERIYKTLNICHRLNGMAIAIGKLVGTHLMEKRDERACFVEYRANLFVHEYEYVKAIEPFPWKGSQGWKEVSMDIKNKIIQL